MSAVSAEGFVASTAILLLRCGLDAYLKLSVHFEMYFGQYGVVGKGIQTALSFIGVCEKPKSVLERIQLYLEGQAYFNALLLADMKASYKNLWERQIGSDLKTPAIGPFSIGLLPDATATGQASYGLSVTQTVRLGYMWTPTSSGPIAYKTFVLTEHPFEAAIHGTAELKLKLKPRLLLEFDAVIRVRASVEPYVGVNVTTDIAVKQAGLDAFYFSLTVPPFYGILTFRFGYVQSVSGILLAKGY
ncbi:hypothetical protein HDU89_003690 [Geranomyces variabilis]|nr:hypothetical protein HDU89_003690 [Geranomyces variabilis]